MKKILILQACSVFFINTVKAQTANEKELLTWFDTTVQQKNLPINSGVKYSEKHRTSDKTIHFLSKNFVDTDIQFKGQIYYNIPSKYDILNDNLIVRIRSKNENYSLILNKNDISSFIINGKKFIKQENHFFEIVRETDQATLLKKYTAKKKEFIKENKLNLSFAIRDKYFALTKDKKLTPLDTKKNWISIFPSQSKLIKKSYKTSSPIALFFKLTSKSNHTNQK